MDLSIVIIGWNVREYLRKCLSSIYSKTTGISFETIVVDNNSSDGSQQMIKDGFPWVQLIENKENLGFAKANNQAISKTMGQFILLLNPDTLLCDKAVERMFLFMQSNSKVGIVGPKLLNSDLTVQLSCHIGPSLISSILTWVLPELLYERLCLLGNKPREVGYVSGAGLLVRRKTIEEIGLLDEDFFMYSEEADWCLRARRRGWRVYFLPSAEIIHYGRVSVRNFGLVAMSKIRTKNNYLLIRKNFGRFKAGIFYSFVLAIINMRMMFWRVGLVLVGKENKDIKEKLEIYDSIIKGLKLGREQ